MSATDPLAIGVDVGGTKTLLGLVSRDGSVTDLMRVATQRRDPSTVFDVISDYCAAFPGVPVGVGAAGMVDGDGAVHYGSYIRWNGFPLQHALSTRLQVPVHVQNDATVAAWGEWVHQAAIRSLAVIACGTGVGGGAVADGQLVVGRGAAMELGHLTVSGSARTCSCGRTGCLETVASGTAVAERYAALSTVQAERDTAVDGASVVQAANAGDQIAHDVLVSAGVALGEAAVALSLIFDPDRIIFTGGLIHGAADVIVPAARSTFDQQMRGLLMQNTTFSEKRGTHIIRVSTVGASLVVVGAASLAAKRGTGPAFPHSAHGDGSHQVGPFRIEQATDG